MTDNSQPVDATCPYCRGPMSVTKMGCAACHIQVEAEFGVSRLASLPVEHQRFIELFVLAGGSLKEIAEQTGISYPTVRSRLDKVIAALRQEITRDAGPRGANMTVDEKAKVINDILIPVLLGVWPGDDVLIARQHVAEL